jgi:hypothetical protein
MALGQTVGSFVVGQTTVVNDVPLEDVAEYSGGHITNVQVTNHIILRDGMHQVTIDAVIDTDKINERYVITDSAIDPNAVQKHVEQAQSQQVMATKLNNFADMYHVSSVVKEIRPSDKRTAVDLVLKTKESSIEIDTSVPLRDKLHAVSALVAPFSLTGSGVIRSLTHMTPSSHASESICFSPSYTKYPTHCYNTNWRVNIPAQMTINVTFVAENDTTYTERFVIPLKGTYVDFQPGTTLFFSSSSRSRTFRGTGSMLFQQSDIITKVTAYPPTNMLRQVTTIKTHYQ